MISPMNKSVAKAAPEIAFVLLLTVNQYPGKTPLNVEHAQRLVTPRVDQNELLGGARKSMPLFLYLP
jgi:hypothetical protein